MKLKSLFHLYDLFISQNKLFCDIQEIRSKMFHKYKEKQSADTWYKLKLQTYCLIKISYGVEPYVQFNLKLRTKITVCTVTFGYTTVSSRDR